MADDARGDASLESMSCALTRNPRATHVKQGKITMSARVAHALDLVAVVDDG